MLYHHGTKRNRPEILRNYIQNVLSTLPSRKIAKNGWTFHVTVSFLSPLVKSVPSRTIGWRRTAVLLHPMEREAAVTAASPVASGLFRLVVPSRSLGWRTAASSYLPAPPSGGERLLPRTFPLHRVETGPRPVMIGAKILVKFF